MDIRIRRAVAQDAQTLAYIQTESWKSAFKGIIPDDTLASCTDLNRAQAMYERTLNGQMGSGYILFLDGKAQTIAWWNAARDEDLPIWAELIMIHSLPEGRRKGCGRRMLEKVFEDVRAAGYKNIALWVFTKNTSARAFYEAMGFRPDGCTKLGYGAEEMRYAREL